MELHPIIDENTSELQAGIWYVVSSLNDVRPSPRVGHTCNYLKRPSGIYGKVFMIGGANPSQLFCDVQLFDPETHQWKKVADGKESGFCGRYEHAAFIPTCDPEKIYIFGGANQDNNFNDIQRFDTRVNQWSNVKVSGTPPVPRTCRSTASIDNKLFIYSGGLTGPDPVADRQVNVFDAESLKWSTLTVTGEPPKPRHGHTICLYRNRLFVFGGMAGVKFYNDLHILDIDKMTWTAVKQKKNWPIPRAGHSAAIYRKKMYVFGGLVCQGIALDDMYMLDTGTS